MRSILLRRLPLVLIFAAAVLQGCKKEATPSKPAGAMGAAAGGQSADAGSNESGAGSSTTPAPSAIPAPPPRNPPLDLGTLTAQALIAKCKADPQAKKNLEGATVTITGVVDSVTRDTSNRGVVSVKGEKSSLNCYTIDRQPWKTIGTGQQVKVSAILGFDPFENPRLVQATIQSQGPTTILSTTAEALQTQYAADRKGVDARYAGKSVKITGRVSSKQVRGTSAVLYLGADENAVHCQFTGYSETLSKMFDPIKEGQTVTVVGTWASTLDRADPPTWAKLRDCNLVQ